MGNIHGRHTVVTIDGVDISGFTDNTEFSDGVDTHDTTTYGASRKRYDSGLGDGTISIGGTHSNETGNPRSVLKPMMAAGLAVEFVYRPDGTGSGKPQSAVNVIVKSYKDSSPVANMVKWTCELQMTDDLNEADQA
jgi:hypothetical protein